MLMPQSWFRRGAVALAVTLLVAAVPVVVAAAPASAGCGDPSQSRCSDPGPTIDQPVLLNQSTTDGDPPSNCDANCEQAPQPTQRPPYCHGLRRHKPPCTGAVPGTNE